MGTQSEYTGEFVIYWIPIAIGDSILIGGEFDQPEYTEFV